MVLTLSLPLLAVTPAWAAEFRLHPGLELKQEYNDNLFMDEDDPADDFITTAAPGLEFERNTEQTKIKLSGRLDVVEYHDYADFSAVDQKHSGQLRFQQSPRLGLSLGGDYLRDHRPDRDFVVSGLLFDATRRERWNAGGGVNFALTERSRLEGRYTYASEWFPEDSFSDSDTHYFSVSHGYDWTPRLSQSLTLDYSRTDYDAARTDNLTLSIGLSAVLAERWNLDGALGARYTDSEYEVYDWVFMAPVLISVKKDERTEESGGVAHLNVTYRGDETRLTGDVRHDVQLASGRSAPVQQTAMTLDLALRLHPEISGYLLGGYYYNDADGLEPLEEEIDSRTLRLTGGLRWDPTLDWGVALDYQFARYDDRVDDTEADRHLVALQLLYRLPLWD